MSRWVKGERIPRPAQMTVLARATSGAVGPADFFSAESTRQGFAETQAPFATEARALGLDPDAIAAKAVQDAIRAEKQRRWQEDNRAAMDAQNAWVEKHGLPLAKHRMF